MQVDARRVAALREEVAGAWRRVHLKRNFGFRGKRSTLGLIMTTRLLAEMAARIKLVNFKDFDQLFL